MLTERDICILIPTFNRSKDVNRLVESIINCGTNPKKLIVLDQSKDNKTKKIINNYSKKNHYIEYKHYKIPSKNNALNHALEKVKEKYKLIFLIDDDVEVFKDFIKNVLEEFNKNPEIKGIGAVDLNDYNKYRSLNYESFKFKLTNKLLDFMLLPHKENNKFRIIGPYGNTMTPRIDKDIKDCQWIPGFVMCYKSEIFKNYKIPERIGYDISEDIDPSYYIYRKYGVGSLVISKKIKVYHHYSQVGRYLDKKRIFVNHEDHLNFYFRQFPGLINLIKLIWEVFWIIVLNVFRLIIKPKRENLLKLTYLFQALSYCIKYRKEIKKGRARFFLNEDLSMKEKF